MANGLYGVKNKNYPKRVAEVRRKRLASQPFDTDVMAAEKDLRHQKRVIQTQERIAAVPPRRPMTEMEVIRMQSSALGEGATDVERINYVRNLPQPKGGAVAAYGRNAQPQASPIRTAYNQALGGFRTKPQAFKAQRAHQLKLQRQGWHNLTRAEQERIASQGGYASPEEFENLGALPVSRRQFGSPEAQQYGMYEEQGGYQSRKPVDERQLKALEIQIGMLANEPAKQAQAIEAYKAAAGNRASPQGQAMINMYESGTLPMGALAEKQHQIQQYEESRLRYARETSRMKEADQNRHAGEFLSRVNLDSFYPADAVASDPELAGSLQRVQQLLADSGQGAPNAAILKAIDYELQTVAKPRMARWAKKRNAQIQNIYAARAAMTPEQQANHQAYMQANQPELFDAYMEATGFADVPPQSKRTYAQGGDAPQGKEYLQTYTTLTKHFGDLLEQFPKGEVVAPAEGAERDAFMEKLKPETIIAARDAAVGSVVRSSGLPPEDVLNAWNDAFNARVGESGVFAPPNEHSRYMQQNQQPGAQPGPATSPQPTGPMAAAPGAEMPEQDTSPANSWPEPWEAEMTHGWEAKEGETVRIYLPGRKQVYEGKVKKVNDEWYIEDGMGNWVNLTGERIRIDTSFDPNKPRRWKTGSTGDLEPL